jgi:hypothetical protein
MNTKFDGVCRHKNAVSLKKRERFMIGILDDAAATRAKQYAKGGFIRLISHQLPADFCVDQHSVYLKILATAQQFRSAATPVAQHTKRLPGL